MTGHTVNTPPSIDVAVVATGRAADTTVGVASLYHANVFGVDVSSTMKNLTATRQMRSASATTATHAQHGHRHVRVELRRC